MDINMESEGPIVLVVDGGVTTISRKKIQFSTKETGAPLSLKEIKGLQPGDQLWVQSHCAWDYGYIVRIHRPTKWDGSLRIEGLGKRKTNPGTGNNYNSDPDDDVNIYGG